MAASPPHHRPIVGITCDLEGERAQARRTYADAVVRAGGTPLLLPPVAGSAGAYAAMCDAFVLTGGDDPATEPFGAPTHPSAKLIHPDRQRFETELLTLLRDEHEAKPVLGVCLGMQMMGLIAGGELNQHLPDDVPSHADHEDGRRHAVRTIAGDRLPREGEVVSRHHQAMRTAGEMRIIGLAHDEVIEAIDDPDRLFYVGVQWHPERTGDGPMGDALFTALIAACR